MSLYGGEGDKSEYSVWISKSTGYFTLWRILILCFLLLSITHLAYWSWFDYSFYRDALRKEDYDWSLLKNASINFCIQVTLLAYIFFSKMQWVVFLAAVPPLVGVIDLSTMYFDGKYWNSSEFMRNELIYYIRHAFTSAPTMLYNDILPHYTEESRKTFRIVEAICISTVFYFSLYQRWKHLSR